MKHLLQIALGLGFASASYAQQFMPQPIDQFQMEVISDDTSRNLTQLIFTDADQDNDYDLFIIGFSQDTQPSGILENLLPHLAMQENAGDKYDALFEPPDDAYPGFLFPYGLFYASRGDINGDGHMDLVAHGHFDPDGLFCSLVFYINQGGTTFDSIHAAQFELPSFLYSTYVIPSFVDLDADGDLDVLVSGFEPLDAVQGTFRNIIYYAKNTGTAEAPEFLGWFENPYGISPEPGPSLQTFLGEDLDHDGDVDLLSVSLNTDIDPIKYYENTAGSNGKPVFDGYVVSPFGLPPAQTGHGYTAPALVDIDDDGDQDLFIVHGDGDTTLLEFYENQFCTPIQTNIDETLCTGEAYVIGDQSFTETGSYQVALQTDSGCDSIVNVELTFVEVNDSVIVEGTTLTAAADNAVYQWIDCQTGLTIDGATTRSFTPEESGSYSVNITGLNGCQAVSDCIPVVITATEDPVGGNISLYPNPTAGTFWLRMSDAAHVRKVTIFDMTGKNILVRDGGFYRPFSLAGSAPGVYLLRIEGEVTTVIRVLLTDAQ